MKMIPFVITPNSFIVVRGDKNVMYTVLIKAGGINLPLGFGEYDAQCMATLVAGAEPDEYSPDSLIRNIVVALGASVTKIAIDGMSEDSFRARVFLKKGEEEFSLPAFLSDAIVLGLSFKVPMLIDEQVLMDGTSNEGTQNFLSMVYEHTPEALNI